MLFRASKNEPIAQTVLNRVLDRMPSVKKSESIEIETVMEIRVVDDDGISGVWYGVRLYKVHLDKRQQFAEIPVHQFGDGGFISDVAAERRKSIVGIADALASYIEQDFRRRIGESVIWTRNVLENWLESES